MTLALTMLCVHCAGAAPRQQLVGGRLVLTSQQSGTTCRHCQGEEEREGGRDGVGRHRRQGSWEG